MSVGIKRISITSGKTHCQHRVVNETMKANIIDGKKIADELIQSIHLKVRQRIDSGRRAPGLAVILVGDDPASKVYVRKKQAACEKAGIVSKSYYLPESTTESALINLIQELNTNSDVHGILVQLPLPPQINSAEVLEKIIPEKDADGFHPYNMGKLALRMPSIRPCTPNGIMILFEKTNIDVKGKHAVVVGSSNIVGRPMVLELLYAGATVTNCHRFTTDLEYHVRSADILVVAVGRPGIVDGTWVKPGAAVIDVGINRQENGCLIGDIDFKEASQHAHWITPVPGGVGPMTVAVLLKNTLYAAEQCDKMRL